MDEAKQMVQLQSMQSNQSNQKSEARQAIDDAARAKKRLIKHRVQQQKKKAAKAKVDQAVTEAKGHINEAINNSGVDEAKRMMQCKSQERILIKHQMRQQKKKQLKRKDQAVTEAKAHINEAINNSGVDEAKQMVRIQSMQSNQKLRKIKARGN